LNFLGHLYFSNNDADLMISNLYGDFVKGRDYSHYPEIVQKGIHLHRSIDHFIDTHPAVTELRLSLYPKLPKVAGIAIDLYFDHLLARNWNRYHSKEYTLFLDEFYFHEADFEHELKQEFIEFMAYFRTRKWLDHYPTAFGLAKSCEGVSKRISFENILHKAPIFFLEREKEIEACFEIYMQHAILHFKLKP
jgi:acyl carrier protein phosphodiesterase